MDHCAHFFCDFFYLDIVIFLLRIPASFIFCHPTGWLVFSWMCTDTSLFLSPKECIFLSSFKHHSVVPSGDVSSHPVSFIWTRLAFSILPPSYPKTSTRIYIPLIELFPNMVWFPNMVSKLAYPAWFQRYSFTRYNQQSGMMCADEGMRVTRSASMLHPIFTKRSNMKEAL